MKKTTQIISVIFILCCFNCKKEYSKKDALIQSYYCLSIKNDIGEISNKRNPYYIALARDIQNDIVINDSLIDFIKKKSNELKNKNKEYKNLIIKLKTQHQDSRFFDATLEFLDYDEKLEIKIDSLFKSLINPNSDKEKEKKLGEELQKFADNFKIEQEIYLQKESDFHDDNNISQIEVDSIVDIVNK